jgi:hypothetical protein
MWWRCQCRGRTRDDADAAVRTGAFEGASAAFFAGGVAAGGRGSRGGPTAGGVGAEIGDVRLVR